MSKLSLAQKDLFKYPLDQLKLIADQRGVSSNAKKDELAWLLARDIHAPQTIHKAFMLGDNINYKGKSVLVTGGAGFIGSNLVDALLHAEAKKVRVLDNLSTGQESNLAFAQTHRNFEFINGDIRDLDTCKTACDGINIVFHEAALVSVPKSMEDPLLNNDININGTLNMLIAASEAKVQRFVYASSAAVYGDDPDVPKRESMHRHYPSPYALSKGVDEDYAGLWAYKKALGNGMTSIGLRYFNVYGPRQDPRSPYSGVISIFADRIKNGQKITIFGDGLQTRDFVFVQDIVQANLLAGLHELEALESRIYNVGTGNSVTLLELLNTTKEIVGKTVSVEYGEERPGDIRHSLADITKICNDLGYSPKYKLYDGLKLLLTNT